VTFRRVKCLRNGIGHYLLWISVTNQISLTFLALRLIHLILNKTTSSYECAFDRIGLVSIGSLFGIDFTF
jgi:hypothetical protein